MRLGVLLALGCRSSGEAERRFAEQAAPVLERACATSSCHGVLGRSPVSGHLYFEVDDVGRLVDLEAARATALAAVNTVEAAGTSSLLRKPLDPAWGGVPHEAYPSFSSPDHPDYRALAAWIEAEPVGGEDPRPLDPEERWFALEVQPLLAGAGCMSGGCHGLYGAATLRFDPGLDGAFPIAATRANRRASVRLAHLDGDPRQSRLVRKVLPLGAGGIRHAGGNGQLAPEDPRIGVIVDWICAEREARGGSCGAADAVDVVFAAGPMSDSDPRSLDVFAPGSDLYRAVVGPDGAVLRTEVLTAHLHSDPADVRDPALGPDGRRLVFAMRTREERGHDLHLLDLETGLARRLTADAGPLPEGGLRTYRDPTFGPDGLVWFAAVRTAAWAEDARFADADLYSLDPDRGALQQRTWTPHVERAPVLLGSGSDAGGDLVFSSLRGTPAGAPFAHLLRLAPDRSLGPRVHFGITQADDALRDVRELADGRLVGVVGPLDTEWGSLAVLERNFGPVVTPASDAVLAGYAPPLARIDPGPLRWRDPAPLPDGGLLAAASDGALHRLALSEAPNGSGARLGSSEPWLALPGFALFDPVPVVARRGAVWDGARPGELEMPANPQLGAPLVSDAPAPGLASVVHLGLPVLDALVGNLLPVGTKPVEEELVALRVIAPGAAERLPLDPVSGATTASLGGHVPAYVLGEVPLQADGSVALSLPAPAVVQLQGIDARGMVRGSPVRRWIDLAPGQVLGVGVQPDRYAQVCATCHAQLDGSAPEPLRPDAITGASRVLARYAERDPRRPVPPVELGPDAARSVDFQRDVGPQLEEACAGGGCHSGAAPAAGLSLTSAPTAWFTDAYESLLADGWGSGGGKRWVDEPGARATRSLLVEVLLGAELEAPGSPSAAAPHPGTLTDEEVARIALWIDLGATFVGH